MEHVIAHLERDVERERVRADFLESALRNYAPHAWNDIQRVLDSNYPRSVAKSPRLND